ncbi:MAG TPA: gluconate 2-dehydrogenase subunit 3 family protein [Pyrinomonadaceae bacterium]|nr:gluconate 2-dehydrogenase subunit 3 family protein [Pyrinomonadaceae bacterium]
MSDDDTISRRTALKIIAVGVGAVSAPPVLGQHQHHGMEPVVEAQAPLRFFTAPEIATITVISDLIIPTDEHSPGAKESGVPGFIDLMVSDSPDETKTLWRDGLAAVDRLCQKKFAVTFAAANTQQQVSLLKEISKNEYSPKTIEERFFIAIKGLTVDGYYTSQIGIHQELRYKGNAYLKDFVGCTHPEHNS